MELAKALQHVQNNEYVGRTERDSNFILSIGLHTKEVFWEIHGTKFGECLNIEDAIANDYYLIKHGNTKTIPYELILSGLDIAPSIKNNLDGVKL